MAEVRKYSTLVLVTNSFPYGGFTEDNFVVPELKPLSEEFERVIIMPTTKIGNRLECSLPENVDVDTSWIEHPDWKYKWRRIRYAFKPSVLKSNKRFTDISFAAAAHAFAGVVENWVKTQKLDLSTTLFYTFWLDFTTAALAMLSQRIGLQYVSRAHFHDIYADRSPGLRHQAVECSRGVFCVGDSGCDYLQREMPDLTDKISVIHIGSMKSNPNILTKYHDPQSEELTFLSVSRVTEVKRVDLNYRMLRALAIARPSMTIRWIHVGDGEMMPELRKVVVSDCPKNLIVELKGALPNEEVQRLYVGEIIDWTMLLSTGEGLPIAVCESLSYGVPVVGTMVCGTDEIVNDDCGLPLAADPEPEEFVRGILPYLDCHARFKRLRSGAFDYWQANFDATILRPIFAKMLQTL